MTLTSRPGSSEADPSGPGAVASLRVLHLVGATHDDGGILTVLRHAHDPEGVFRHSVVVHRGVETRRQPPLDLQIGRAHV